MAVFFSVLKNYFVWVLFFTNFEVITREVSVETDTLYFINKKGNHEFNVIVDFNSSAHACDSEFLSVTISLEMIRHHWQGFDFGSEKLQNLANALYPCNLRLGGTLADFLIFDPNGGVSSTSNQEDEAMVAHFDHGYWEGSRSKNFTNFTMTGREWDIMYEFFSIAKWDIMFDFNLFRFRDGLWDPSNAEELLRYSGLRAYNLHAFQLGNEPNAFKYNFNFSIPAATLVKDFRILQSILTKYPPYYKNKLYGPDVTNLDRHSSSRNYLQDFITAGGSQVVSEISLHHYYLNGRTAKASDFYNVSVLNSLEIEFNIAHSYAGGSPIRLTETSSCYGGGAPGLSDAYVAGFLWLDKLGLAAKHRVTKVFRQTFFGGNYALLSPNMDPNPDYYLSLLHKRLIEGPVFDVTLKPSTDEVRIYAHCTREFGLYKKGAITLAYLNTKKENVTVSLGQFSIVDLYILTPGDSAGLKSRFVKLNGETLKMSGSSLPALKPKLHKGDITFPALSFGFVVAPNAKVPLCLKYSK